MKMLPLFLLLGAAALRLISAEVPPVWSGEKVQGDPLFFVQEKEGEPARASLLQVPAAPPVLHSATLETAFEAGRDFEWKPGERLITLTNQTRIPFKKKAELYPAPNSPHSYKACRDGKSWMLFGEGRFFHDLQCVASYQAAASDWKLAAPAAAPETQLGRIRAKLKSGAAVKMVTLGDSISTGANASGAVNAPPRQSGYPGLVARSLEAAFGGKVVEKNLSVGGMDSPWGLKQAGAVIAEKPDLVLLAFGMNDASGRRPAAEFKSVIAQTASAIQAGVPECDVILISSMTANPEWTHAAPELYPAYASALAELAGPGRAFADVTAVWTAVVQRKSVLSLTGNGLNHPNDFGHRIYADVILAVIGGK